MSPTPEARSGLFFNGLNEARADAQAYDIAARRHQKSISLELTRLASEAVASGG